jgi:hypothetical protein
VPSTRTLASTCSAVQVRVVVACFGRTPRPTAWPPTRRRSHPVGLHADVVQLVSAPALEVMGCSAQPVTLGQVRAQEVDLGHDLDLLFQDVPMMEADGNPTGGGFATGHHDCAALTAPTRPGNREPRSSSPPGSRHHRSI